MRAARYSPARDDLFGMCPMTNVPDIGDLPDVLALENLGEHRYRALLRREPTVLVLAASFIGVHPWREREDHLGVPVPGSARVAGGSPRLQARTSPFPDLGEVHRQVALR